MADLLIAPGAEADFTASLKWYAERSTDAAEGFQAAIDHALEAIQAEPDRYSLCDERHRYYRVNRYPFRVVYRTLSDGQLLIVAVAHDRRRPQYWSKR